MKQAFQTLVRVRYAECDAQLVVFNARYGDFVDLAITEFVRELFGSYQAVMKLGYDYQVVKLTTEFKSPAKFDDVLAISVVVSHIGNTSIAYQLDFREYFTQRLVAVSDIVYVMMSCPAYEKVPVPDFFREKLQQGAAGVVANYAGIDLNGG